MMQTRIHFGLGFTIGILIAAVFVHFFSSRFDVTESNNIIIKQDRWSGTSWKYEGNEWVPINENKVDWKPVDDVLTRALTIQSIAGERKSSDQIEALKKRYPALAQFTYEDIMERIKYVYARKVMVDLYFSQVDVE